MPDSRYGPTPDQLADMLEHATTDATWLMSAQRLDQLHRRGWHVAHDAYSQGNNETGIHNTDISRPTEAKALDEHTYTDPTGDSIAHVFQHIAYAEKHLAVARLTADYLLNTLPAKLYGRVTTIGTCQACQCDVSGAYNDRLRSGYCVRCYSRWRRAGMPEHTQFVTTVRNNPDETEEQTA